MSDRDRRVSLRRPLPVGVYLVVDGVRHPGTLRDLSSGGAGFADPVLAVRLELHPEQRVEIEIPPELEGEEVLRLPGEVAHVAAGLRPRLGIQFRALDSDLLSRLIARLGREVPGRRSADGDEAGDMRFVLIEPSHPVARGRALITTISLGAVVVLVLLLLLALLSRYG